MTDTFRALCVELVELSAPTDSIPQLAERLQKLAELANRALAALAQPEPVAPTDDELLELMPETMRAEFSFSAKICSDATGAQVKPGLFRVVLNTAAVEYARAVLARWGTPTAQPVPVPVSERLPLHLAGELDDQGTCWNYHPINLHYCLCVPDPSIHTHWLPHWALPVPAPAIAAELEGQ
jgi:hypothetical protein